MATPLRLRVQKEAIERRNKTNSKGKLIKPLCTIEIRIANAFVGIGQFVKENEQPRWIELCWIYDFLSENTPKNIIADSYTNKITVRPP